MTRSQSIATIKAHAAAGNFKDCPRIFIESRISRAVYDKAVMDGIALGAFVAKRDAQRVAA